jgi:hypothetical protein
VRRDTERMRCDAEGGSESLHAAPFAPRAARCRTACPDRCHLWSEI